MVPKATDGLTGATAIETKPAGFTVSVVEPTMVPEVAVMVVVPVATLVARPAAPIVATPVLDDVQVAELVRF